MQKKKVVTIEHEYIALELRPIEVFFAEVKNKAERDSAIIKAIEEGHKQVDVGKEIGVSDSLISKVVKKWKHSSLDQLNLTSRLID